MTDASGSIRWWRRCLPCLISLALAVLVLALAVASGAVDSSSTTLVLMGFDMDRAQLITSLLIAGTAAAVAVLVVNSTAWATLAGLGVVAALFGRTFAHETRSALDSSGINGSFDAGGFVATLAALLVAGVLSAWAGATLARAVRPGLIATVASVRETIRSRRLSRGRLVRPLALLSVVALLVYTVPVFGDMVNYTPDARMLHGLPQGVGLVPGAAQHFSGTQLSTERPWLAWRPSGSGSITVEKMPFPWKSATPGTIEVAVYTPPGYEASGGRRYPVMYAVPFEYHQWDASVNIRVVLDSLIDSGEIPPMIVAFVNAAHAPTADTECANSVDGNQWLETYMSETVVSMVDGHYRTIAKPSARALMGFSEGGYCAAMLTLRHPSVFGTAIPISGYFWAGDGSDTAALPFGGDVALMTAASPMILATQVPPAQRGGLFFIVVADPSQPLYGVESAEFERLLTFQGYQFLAIDSAVPHGWEQVRQQLPAVLEAWAAHLPAVGAFN